MRLIVCAVSYVSTVIVVLPLAELVSCGLGLVVGVFVSAGRTGVLGVSRFGASSVNSLFAVLVSCGLGLVVGVLISADLTGVLGVSRFGASSVTVMSAA